MRKSSKKALENRGLVVPRTPENRAAGTPGAIAHDDRRKPKRAQRKQQLRRELQREISHATARNRGPWPFLRSFTSHQENATPEPRKTVPS